jgi:hyperosmotically inducible periplasmic protein
MGLKKQNIGKWLTMAGIALMSTGIYAFASSNTDNQIESTAKNTYVFKTFLTNDSIDVESRGGVVTLVGTVSSQSHKSLAEETVRNVAGVRTVNNRLSVKGENVDKNVDGWTAAKVKTTLLFHRNVKGLSTEVDVKNGVVTLRGNAENSAQKDLTTEYAIDIDGVKKVNNEMVVKASEKSKETVGEKIDDASITAQVKMVLLYHKSTSAFKTKVKTIDGVVLLSGKAMNPAEKDLVTKLVKDINGVKEVQNHMTIARVTQG